MGTRPIVRQHGSFRNQAYIWTAEAGAQAVHEKYYLPDEPEYWENTWYDRGERRFDVARVLQLRRVGLPHQSAIFWLKLRLNLHLRPSRSILTLLVKASKLTPDTFENDEMIRFFLFLNREE